MLRRYAFLTAVTLGLHLAVGSATAQELAPVTIVSPKDKAAVEQADEVEGRIDQQGWPVVLIKMAGDHPYYVQPPVESVTDGRFTLGVHYGDAETTPGSRFHIVVLLAKDKQEAGQYEPGSRLKTLPPEVPRSDVVSVSRGVVAPEEREPTPRTIVFSGREWDVKGGASKLGPGPNYFSSTEENVQVDERGRLHLVISKRDGRWQCAEIVAPKSLGYGEYRWVVSGDLAKLDPGVVLGLFTYEDVYHEIDFELARWGSRTNDNAQFVVQPPAKDSMKRFDSGNARVLTISLDWGEKVVRGRCWVGEDVNQAPLADWTYSGRKIPKPGRERARANLWLFNGAAPSGSTKQEVVIQSFQFRPAGSSDDLKTGR